MAFYDDFHEPKKKDSGSSVKHTGNKFGKYVRGQLEYSGMPKRLINLIEPLTPPYDDYSLHMDDHQLKERKVPGHVYINSLKDARRILSALIADGCSIAYKGAYSYHYSSISLNNLTSEVRKEDEGTRYSMGHWFCGAIEVHYNTRGGKFIFSFICNSTLEEAQSFRGPSREYLVKHFSAEMNKMVEKLQVPGSHIGADVSDFINYCRGQIAKRTRNEQSDSD